MPTALQATQAASPGRLSSPGKQGSPPSQKHPGQDKGKKPPFQNRTWVRGRDPGPAEGSPDGLDTGRPSLLSRLKIDPPSLLNRIALSEEASASSSLAGRLEPLLVDMGDGGDTFPEDVKMREEGIASNEVRVKVEETTATIPSPKSERRVGKARGSRSTINVFGEPAVPSPSSNLPDLPETPTRQDVDTRSPSPAPVSESAVEDLLATILPSHGPLVTSPSPEPSMSASRNSEAETRALCEEDANMTASRPSMSAEPVGPTPGPSSLPQPVLEQCRDLLVPAMIQFAIRRNPGLDAATAQERILSRLSDQQCAEFIKLARRMREELQEHGDAENNMAMSRAGSRSPSKRPIGGDERDSSERRPIKIARKHSPEDAVDADGAAEPVTNSGLSASRDHSSDPASHSREGSHVSEIVAEAPTHASPAEPLRVASRGRSRTPTSGLACSSSASRPAAHALPGTVTAHLPSAEEAIPSPGNAGLPGTRSREASESSISASTSLPSATVSHSTTAPALQHPQSSQPAATQHSCPSVPSGALHHDSVTPVPPATSKIPEDTSTQVAQELLEDQMQVKEYTEEPPMQQHPSTLVPALWSAVRGRSSPGIEAVEFFVDDATAAATQHWACRKETFSFEHRHVKVHLLCLPEALVSEYYQNMSPNATREDIVDAMWNIKTVWPAAGTLVVKTDSPGNSWLPGHDPGPLDLTHAIKRGMNKFELIQLADMSDKLFMIHATEPSEEERKAVGSLTIGWTRTLGRLAPQSPRRASRTPLVA
ncbi:hypothetical protein OH77DRAFT_1446364 [Trametes cingulata]|nr:hypothetical protein OH77DRAFT_1446364 [Trametes cingulata]